MTYPSIALAQTTIALCEHMGLKHIVISPGSRNAPLTIGFTENPFFKTYSIVDERCAAFFALGIAQQTNEPVALTCTSGSALLNYYPAIAEAYYSRIPLVILSADRPEEFIDIGDGQTIRQANVYDNHILYSANCEEAEDKMLSNQERIAKALQMAKHKKGPVHINLPFTEPLYEKLEVASIEIDRDLTAFIPSTWHVDISSKHREIWNRTTKKMVLVGVLSPGSIEQKLVERLLKDPSVLVLTESTSNLHHSKLIPTIDMLLAGLTEEELQELQPDLLLTFGGLVVSKKIKSFLRTYKAKTHWHVDAYRALDTYFLLSEYFPMPIQDFLQGLLVTPTHATSNYQAFFFKKYQERIAKRESFSKEVVYSDFGVYARIFKHLPEIINLQLSNSATIRYGQLFTIPESVAVFCNRGTSGIDGSTSTAIGAAVGAKKQTLLVTGDLSFFYDSNALWNDNIPKDFRVIIVNNSGGGIFRIIPGPKNAEKFSTYFETKHELNAKHLAKMYNFAYKSVIDYESLDTALNDFYEISDRPKIIEIFTPREENEGVLQEYFKYIHE